MGGTLGVQAIALQSEAVVKEMALQSSPPLPALASQGV